MIPGGGQMPDVQELLQKAHKMQQELAAAQQELAETSVEGSAGGGLVKATVDGSGELKGLVIDPKVMDPEDTEMLADLVVAAIRDATASAKERQQSKLGPLAQGIAGLPGMPF